MDSDPQSTMDSQGSTRPQSASSRTAWGDADGIDNPATTFEESVIETEPPTYPGNTNQHANTSGSDKSGCSGCCKRGIRSLWATRQTENTLEDKELHVKIIVRELIVYIFFLITLCIVTFAMTGQEMFFFTKVMNELFLDTSFKDSNNNYRGITTMQDFWRFADGPMVDGLYWEKWYNNENLTADELGFIYYENKLLGVPRLRQIRVTNQSCIVHQDFKDEIINCYSKYGGSVEDKDPFGKMSNDSAWNHQDEGSGHWGQVASYNGGGYIQNLNMTKAASKAILNDLKTNLWLDRGTRVVFVEFTVYNANINLFCVVRLVVEFPATGGAIPSWDFRTVKLIRYVTTKDYFVLACEAIFCLFILYYIVEEAIEISKLRGAYFKSFQNILDLVIILISLICIGFNVYRTLAVSSKLKEMHTNPQAFYDYDTLSYWQNAFNIALAITVFLAWVKLFKYISFNKTMTQLSSTLSRCAKDLAGFAVMFCVIFLAFAQLGYLIFGTQVEDFSSFEDSIFTLFRIILGDFSFHELEEANRVLGPAYFILYVFFVFFILLNMFLAIINDTYTEVKADLAHQKNEFEMTDYFKKGYYKMLKKMNLKQDKIVGLQKAIKQGDSNKDKQLDYNEWQKELKVLGYSEAHIKGAFDKFDVDENKTLDQGEQKRMLRDLEEQKAAIQKDYEDMIGKGRRSKSARSRTSYDDSGEDSDDEESGTKSTRGTRTVNGVAYEEFTVLSRRVDRMEHSIGSIVSKIDAVLVKLEAMEKAKSRRRETMSKLLDSITESDAGNDEMKKEEMERLVRAELERWDSESSLGQASGRGTSPSGSSKGGSRSRGSDFFDSRDRNSHV